MEMTNCIAIKHWSMVDGQVGNAPVRRLGARNPDVGQLKNDDARETMVKDKWTTMTRYILTK